MHAIATTHQQIENGTLLLRKVYQRSASLPAAARKRAVQICLAYELKNHTGDEAGALLNGIYANLGGAGTLQFDIPDQTAEASMEGSAHSPEVKALLVKLIKRMSGQDADINESIVILMQQVDSLFDEFNIGLHEAAKKQRFLGMSMMELLSRVKQRSDDNDDALNQAANESFNRLLTSLNPESAESYLDSSKMKIGPFHKAALFDALIEKYQQLKAYHEKGRLVRDFKGMYRTHLGQIAKENSGD